MGWLIPENDSSKTGGTPSELMTLFNPFWETWQLVHAQFIDQPVDDEKLMQGAINGMLESLGINTAGI